MKSSLARRVIRSLAFLATLAVAVWLGACSVASVISPLRAKYLALFSLTTAFAIIANILIALAWLIFARRKWNMLLPLLALFFSYRLVLNVFGWHFFEHQEMFSGEHRLKVMAWNVHGMGIFDRPLNRTTDERIIEMIKTEGPDVLCLSEFYTVHNNALRPYSTTLMNACGYREFRFKYDNTLGTKIYMGTAIFSRYPISNYVAHALHTRRDGQSDVVMLQYDVLLPDSQIVRVFFTHLQSFLLSDGEKTYLEEVKNRDRDMPVAKSRSYVRRFGEAYVKRSIQADMASSIIAQSPYPVLLCGDFNDMPGSYTYEKMRGNLEDAFATHGFGLGRTFNLFSPTLRIDYIFYNPRQLRIIGFNCPATSLSDHNPVIANFEIMP